MFHQPHTLAEALDLKSRLGSEAAFLAGGTDVIVMMNHGRVPCRQFIDLSQIAGFSAIAPDHGSSKITTAGGTCFSQLARLPIKCLAEASLSVGGPQIRNRATIAGNLATASPAGDGSTALLALDARLTLRSVSGSRTLSLSEFFLDYRKTALAPTELIESVTFPADWKTSWVKLGKRGAMNISVVCCAVGLSPAGQFHLAFGSVGPHPIATPTTARFLSELLRDERGLSEKNIDEACRMISEEVRPIDDFRASAQYRRAMAAALLRKALREIPGILTR